MGTDPSRTRTGPARRVRRSGARAGTASAAVCARCTVTDGPGWRRPPGRQWLPTHAVRRTARRQTLANLRRLHAVLVLAAGFGPPNTGFVSPRGTGIPSQRVAAQRLHGAISADLCRKGFDLLIPVAVTDHPF